MCGQDRGQDPSEQNSRIISEIIEVPLPRADSRRLISFFTFHISIFFSASFACGALMASDGSAGQVPTGMNGTSTDMLSPRKLMIFSQTVGQKSICMQLQTVVFILHAISRLNFGGGIVLGESVPSFLSPLFSVTLTVLVASV